MIILMPQSKYRLGFPLCFQRDCVLSCHLSFFLGQHTYLIPQLTVDKIFIWACDFLLCSIIRMVNIFASSWGFTATVFCIINSCIFTFKSTHHTFKVSNPIFWLLVRMLYRAKRETEVLPLVHGLYITMIYRFRHAVPIRGITK